MSARRRTATLDGGYILGARSIPGNPYDGHTLAEALKQVEILTGRRPLKGTAGGGIFAVLCACGHHLRKILAHLRALLSPLLAALLTALGRPEPRHGDLAAA